MIDGAHGYLDIEIARKFESLDQLDDVGLVFEPGIRLSAPTVQFEGDELFQGDELRRLADAIRRRQRTLAFGTRARPAGRKLI